MDLNIVETKEEAEAYASWRAEFLLKVAEELELTEDVSRSFYHQGHTTAWAALTVVGDAVSRLM